MNDIFGYKSLSNAKCVYLIMEAIMYLGIFDYAAAISKIKVMVIYVNQSCLLQN